jgi:succinate dehydrogenase / fumarate reductase cytochrome b subunit
MMMNICSTCQGAQSECQERLDANAEYREHVNESLAPEGLATSTGIQNKHFLWLMVEEIGLDVIEAKVVRPLTDLKVGPFYGCYIVRPTDRVGIDEDPPARPLPADAHRGAGRHGGRLRRARTSAAASRSSP